MSDLHDLSAPLERLRGKTSPDASTAIEHLDLARTELEATTKRNDGLIRVEVPPMVGTPTVEPALSPLVTLVGAGTRLRDFGASDVGLREDLDDASAKTLATLLTIPLSYYAHSGRVDSVLAPDGNPNDSRVLSLGAALDIHPSLGAFYQVSYQFNRSTYPYDSVYSNNENRLRLGARYGVGRNAVLFGDASIGFRSYTNTLSIVRQQGPRKNTLLEVGGDFTQITFGLGLALTPSDQFTIGGAAALALNTNLRAYITNVGVDVSNRKIRRAAQIADDEYSYDLTRGAGFAAMRLPLDIDLGLDLAYEHRVYGTVANKQAQQFVEGAGRTDNQVLAAASFSRLFAFEERALSVFDGVSVEASISLTDVNSTNSLYSYSDVDVLAGFTLSF